MKRCQKSYHRDNWLASYHCEAEFTKRWIVHPQIYALELSFPIYAISTYAFSTLSNGSVAFFLFFLFTRARAAAAASASASRLSRNVASLASLAAMRDAGLAKKSHQSPQKVLVDIDSRTVAMEVGTR